MKTLQRNHAVIYYALPTGKTEKTDSFGNLTGVPEVAYGTPRRYRRLSAQKRKGSIKAERFGLSEDYVDTFVTDDMDCPITVDTRLWVGTCPANNQPYTHVVQAIIPSLNVIQIVAKEVSVS